MSFRVPKVTALLPRGGQAGHGRATPKVPSSANRHNQQEQRRLHGIRFPTPPRAGRTDRALYRPAIGQPPRGDDRAANQARVLFLGGQSVLCTLSRTPGGHPCAS